MAAIALGLGLCRRARCQRMVTIMCTGEDYNGLRAEKLSLGPGQLTA